MAIRKIIKMSRGTLMISIPKDVVESMDIEPGDHADLTYNEETRALEVRKVKITPQ